MSGAPDQSEQPAHVVTRGAASVWFVDQLDPTGGHVEVHCRCGHVTEARPTEGLVLCDACAGSYLWRPRTADDGAQ